MVGEVTEKNSGVDVLATTDGAVFIQIADHGCVKMTPDTAREIAKGLIDMAGIAERESQGNV